jgi:predicted dehydrogenase
MAYDFSRRYFFFGSLLAGAIPSQGFGSTLSLKAAGYKSPNEKLNIASIGAGGKAVNDIDGCSHENIVALCDVDEKSAARKFNQYEKVPKFKDYRKMLDAQGRDIDAVIVTIPDFMHAPAAIACMERGKHVYVQKPLVRTVAEARLMLDAANKYKVATQMGNQGYSNEGTRQTAEMIWAGEIGNVKEVHAWTDRPWWPQGLTSIPAPDAVPATLDWDLWLGNAAKRPYTSGGQGYPNKYGNFYQPFNWRGFYDFGCGALGDMAVHILGAANMALQLSHPTSVECVSKEGTSEFMFPKKAVIRYDFPARGSMPPVSIFWYEGLKERPKIKDIPDSELLGDLPAIPGRPAPVPNGFVGGVFSSERYEEALSPQARASGPNGSVFIGDKGMLTTGSIGEHTRLLPAAERMRDYKFPEPSLVRSPGHYRDWIRACKGGDPACSNFKVSAPYVEWMLLGTIALRVEGKLEWDAAKSRFANSPEANRLLKPSYLKT